MPRPVAERLERRIDTTMASILSGQCDDFEVARAVVDELLTLGMPEEELEIFALNAPGQHARFPPRPAGVRVVAHVPTRQHRECVLATFERHDTRSIEEAEGTWRDGSWVDFDPVSVPRWIKPPHPQ